MSKNNNERGSVNPLLVGCILLGILAAGLAGGFIWAYSSFTDQRDNVQAKVNEAVDEAKKTQRTNDEKEFTERLKEPYEQLVGPDDLGRVTFNYPKTWSVYVARDGSNNQFEAYLYPKSVPAVNTTTAYAARILITPQSYENSLRTYEALVKRGDLKSSPITISNFTGVRLDGKFSNSRNGAAVVFKVRDKTLTVVTDASTYLGDFNDVILKSLNFNP